MEYLKLKSFRNEIAETRGELIILRRALDKHVETDKSCGMARFHNPISISLRHEIEEHEVLLQQSERRLMDMEEPSSLEVHGHTRRTN